jgi:hypothetical protein
LYEKWIRNDERKGVMVRLHQEMMIYEGLIVVVEGRAFDGGFQQKLSLRRMLILLMGDIIKAETNMVRSF